MPHILKNNSLEVHIDLPHENYQTSRFDWSGKIQTVIFQGIPLTITEKNDSQNEHLFGKGFYNEFGIETALGFEEAEIGDWFHKIGIGLLRKNESEYFFHKEFEIQPAEFSVSAFQNGIEIKCYSQLKNGYAYELIKRIDLKNDGLTIFYFLKNIGKKDIQTNEYAHNFIAINKELINSNYILRLPCSIKPKEFEKIADPESNLKLSGNRITFNQNVRDQFFIGNITGDESLQSWELIHSVQKISIKEIVSFKAVKVNLWGWKHVISPELFHHIHLKPNESTEWTRRYEIFKID